MEFLGTLVIALILGAVWSLIKAGSRAAWRKASEPKDSLRKAERDADLAQRDYNMSEADAQAYKDSQRLGVAFGRFAMIVAMADGSVTESEFGAIISFFRGAHPNFLQFVSQSMQRDLKNPKSIDWDYSVGVLKSLLAKKRFEGVDAIIFDGLLRIAAADGHIAPSEVGAVFNLMTKIGWEQDKTRAYFRSRFGDAQDDESRDSSKVDDAFHVLGLEPDATIEEVRARYRELAKTHHPDMYSRLGPEMQNSANNRFNLIREAYETVIDARAS